MSVMTEKSMKKYTVLGSIDTYEVAKEENLVPIGLINNAIVKKDIKKGEFITYDMVDLDTSTTIYKLRQEQEKINILAALKGE